MIHYVSAFSVTDDLRETLRKENCDFPFSANELNVIEYVNNCAKWHWHGFVEFSFVVEGAVECCTPGGTIIAETGEGYFINANVLHMVRMASTATDAKYRVLQFETSMVGGTEGIYAKYVAPVENCKRLEAFQLSRGNSGQNAALNAMEELFQIAAQEPPCYELVALNKIVELWSCLYILVKSVLQEEQPISDASADRVKQMLAFIHANYADAVCVDAIAASANISRREAFRSFRQVLGTTPTLYLLQHRVNRAARLLMETSSTVTEISSACGFSTSSYFTKVFHDLTGVSPRDFRRRSRGACI